MPDEYRRFWITSIDALEREILLATAFEAGAEGAEETEEAGRFRACIYANATRIEEVRRIVMDEAGSSTEVDAVERLPDVDWDEAWKEGLEALRISSRLVVRPPFIEAPLESGQREIVIDPGQAFGTGAHASTQLCLEWIDALTHEPKARAGMDRVLDVGTGSGVLALSAVALGAERAVGFDLDPIAIEAAQEAAQKNALDRRVEFFVGPIEAIGPREPAYPLVLANLLKREMLPIASELARCLAPNGRLVLAGLLDEDVGEVLERFAEEGLGEVGRRSRQDSVGVWVGLCLGFA
jgi:ribosomal protein L11 methyltransferase